MVLKYLYQLTDSTPKKNCPVHDRICPIRDVIYAKVLVQLNKYLINIKRTLK